MLSGKMPDTADLSLSARKVRRIGYAGVQISSVGPIPETQIAAVIRKRVL